MIFFIYTLPIRRGKKRDQAMLPSLTLFRLCPLLPHYFRLFLLQKALRRCGILLVRRSFSLRENPNLDDYYSLLESSSRTYSGTSPLASRTQSESARWSSCFTNRSSNLHFLNDQINLIAGLCLVSLHHPLRGHPRCAIQDSQAFCPSFDLFDLWRPSDPMSTSMKTSPLDSPSI